MSAEKDNGRKSGKVAPVNSRANVSTAFYAGATRFAGTDNPRHLRVIQALMTRPLPRQQLDAVAGASNGPELVAELRRRGLELPCTRTKKVDRDGFDVLPGVYHFTHQDRRRVFRWMAQRKA